MDRNFCTNADGNLTLQQWTLEGGDAISAVVFASFLLVFELIGLPWNILVLVTIVKEKLYHQPAVILLLNLIVADLFILLVPTPLLMTSGFSGEFILGSSDEVRCKWCQLGFFLLIPVYNSMFTVALMSLDRFFYIYTPFKYERNSTKYFSVIAVILCTLCSIALGFTSLSAREVSFNPRLLICVGENSEAANVIVWVFLTVIGAVILFVIIAANLSFSCIVFKHIRAVYSYDDVTTEKDYKTKKQICHCRLMKRMQSTRHLKQRRLCRMLFALLIISIISLVPIIVLLIWTILGPPPETSVSDLVTVVLILHYSQVILNPILETSLITDIRHPMKAMLTCGKLRKKIESISEECDHTSLHINKCSFWLAMFEVGRIPSESSTVSSAESAGRDEGTKGAML